MFPITNQRISPNPPIRTSSLPSMFDQRVPNSNVFIRPSPSGRGETLISKKEATLMNNSKSVGKGKKKQKKVGMGEGDGDWLDEIGPDEEEGLQLRKKSKENKPSRISSTARGSPKLTVVNKKNKVQLQEEASRQKALTQLVTMLLDQSKQQTGYSQLSTSWKIKYGLTKDANRREVGGRRNFTSEPPNGLLNSAPIRSTNSMKRIASQKKRNKKIGGFKALIRGLGSCTGAKTTSDDGHGGKGLRRRSSNRSAFKQSRGQKSPRRMETVVFGKANVESEAWVDISLNSGRNQSFLGISLSSHTIQEEEVSSNIPTINRISPSPTASLASIQVEHPTPTPAPVHPCDRESNFKTSAPQVPRALPFNSKVIYQSHLREVQNIDSFDTSEDSIPITVEGDLSERAYSSAKVQSLVTSSTPPRESNKRVFSNRSVPDTLLDGNESEEFISPSERNLVKGRESLESKGSSNSDMVNYLKFGPSIGLANKEVRRASPREELLKQKQQMLNEKEKENLSRSRSRIRMEGEMEDLEEEANIRQSEDLPEWIENFCSTPPHSNRHLASTSTPAFNQASNSHPIIPVSFSTIGSKKERKVKCSKEENEDDAETSISFSAWVDMERYHGIAGSRSASGGHLRSISGKHVLDRDVFVEGLEARSGLDRLCEALDEAQVENAATDEELLTIQQAYLAPLISTSGSPYPVNQRKSSISSETRRKNDGGDIDDDCQDAESNPSDAIGLEHLSHSDSAKAITRALGLGGIVTLDSAELSQLGSQRDLVSESDSSGTFASDNIFYAREESNQRIQLEEDQAQAQETSFERAEDMNLLMREMSHLEEVLDQDSKPVQNRVGSGELKLDDFLLENSGPSRMQDDQESVDEMDESDKNGSKSPLPPTFSPPTSPASFDHHLTSTPCSWFLSTIEENEEEEGEIEQELADDTFARTIPDEAVIEESGSSNGSSRSVDQDDSSIGLALERGHTIWKEDYHQQALAHNSSPILSKILKVTQSPSLNNLSVSASKESLTELKSIERYELDDECEEERLFKQGIYASSLNQSPSKPKKSSNFLSPSLDQNGQPNPALSPILESPNPSQPSSRFKNVSATSSSEEVLPLPQSSSSSRKEKPASLWGDASLLKGACPQFSFSKPMEEGSEDKERFPNSPISPTSLSPPDSSTIPINENKRGSWSSYESEVDSRRMSTASGSSSQGHSSVATSVASVPISNQFQTKPIEEVGIGRMEKKITANHPSSTNLKRSESQLSFRSEMSSVDGSEVDCYHSSNESEISHGGIIDGFPVAPVTISTSTSSEKTPVLGSTNEKTPTLSSTQRFGSSQDQFLDELKLQLENKKTKPKVKLIQAQSTSIQLDSKRNSLQSSGSEGSDRLLTTSTTSGSMDGDDQRFRHRISPGIAARFQAAYSFQRPVGLNPNLSQSNSNKTLVEPIQNSQL